MQMSWQPGRAIDLPLNDRYDSYQSIAQLLLSPFNSYLSTT